MSNTSIDVTSKSTYTMDNATFDVFNGASLTLTGSSDTVIMESGSTGAIVSGNGNTISGTNANGVNLSLSGTGNVATLGANSSVNDNGNGDTITVGAGSNVAASGTNATINATTGGSQITLSFGSNVANANNDTIFVTTNNAEQVNGDGNQIAMFATNSTLNLDGSNNTVSFDTHYRTDTIQTATGSLTENADGTIVLKGSANLNSVALSGGIATVQLGNRNVATLSGVTSGATFEYIDSSGAITTSILTDSNLLHTGGSLYEVVGNVTAKMDNAIFSVLNGVSLNLTGSSDTVIMGTGSTGVNVSGNGNTISGTNANGVNLSLSGTGNVATLGANTSGTDNGNGDTITVGANSNVAETGTNATINATAGGSRITFWNAGNVANANNDTIIVAAGNAEQVNGNGNQISVLATNSTLSLGGSNNTVSFDTHYGMDTIQTATGSLTENADGTIVLKGSANLNSIALSGGIATVQLGNGNVATLSGVTSGVTFEYIDSSGAITTSILTDSNLLHIGGSLYEVVGNATARMDNTMFSVLNGASLTLTGSSDTVIMGTGSTGVNVSGSGNVISGTDADRVNFSLSGTGNVATLGANTVGDDNGNGDTITVGANSHVNEKGNNGTVNATAGGSNITLWGAGDVANANNDTILLVGSAAQVNGNGNQMDFVANNGALNLSGSNNTISLKSNDTVSVNGSNNTITDPSNNNTISLNGGNNTLTANSGDRISLAGSNNTVNLNGINNAVSFDTSAGAQMIQAATGYYVEEDANGLISFYGTVSVKNGVASIGLGNGNVVTISGVRSSSNPDLTATDGQLNQLVSAMASYQNGSGGVSSTFMTQAPTDSSLFASSHH
jgi:hypothetical protein